MGLSFWQIAIVVILLVLLFGRGKISALMGDLAGGIKSFKKGMSDDDEVIAANSDKAAKVETVENTDQDKAAKS
jgi:sec-independent protein translocase protein TatA